MPRERRYFLVKSEPESFSFDDLMKSPKQTTCWDGVRNYQARNTMRDDMKKGDGVLFYHSSTEPPQVVGIAEVAREAYPDHTALDPKHPHFDPRSKAGSPTWMMVDIKGITKLAHPLPLSELRGVKGLEKMTLLQKGSRLSVQPVTADEWAIVERLGAGATKGSKKVAAKGATKSVAKAARPR